MRLRKEGHFRKIGTAFFLSGAVLFTVNLTQPRTVDNPQSGNPVNNPMETIQVTQRTYEPSENAGIRAPEPDVQAKPTEDFTYSVIQGDTLYDLALRFGVSVDMISAANGLASDMLSIGQKLLIPASGEVKVVKVARTPAKKAPVIAKTSGTVSRSKYSGRAQGELIPWDEAAGLLARGESAAVIDVDTGYTFNIKRKGGTNHADCEPLTKDDTAIMKKIYGSWSWNRRAVVVSVDGKNIAASMAGMPHGSQTLTGNGFAGHFDIHFLDSMTHGSSYTKSGKPMVDSQHQAMVKKAAGQ